MAKHSPDIKESSLYRRVKAILRQDPRARDSDSILLVHLLQASDVELTDEQIKGIINVSLDALRLARESIQSDGEYYPSVDIARARGMKVRYGIDNAASYQARRIERIMGLDEGSCEVITLPSDLQFDK